MKKQIIILFLILLVIPTTLSLETLKPAKLNSPYVIIQTCATCSYVNFSLSNQNGIILNNMEMTNNGSGGWVYTYTPTSVGRHDVTGIGDLDGNDKNFATYFEVTGSGFINSLGFYFLIFLIPASLIVFGYKIEDAPIVILGGFALVLVGLYILFFGIDSIKDPVYTWGLGIITLMTGAYFGTRASIEMMN